MQYKYIFITTLKQQAIWTLAVGLCMYRVAPKSKPLSRTIIKSC